MDEKELEKLKQKIWKNDIPGLNEQVPLFHSFSFLPAYRKAFRKEASEAPCPLQGNQAEGNRRGEDFATRSEKSPTVLKEHPQARQSFQGNKIVQVDGSPVPYI